MALCRTEQFEVSPPISGLTPWGHNKKKEQMQTRCLTLVGEMMKRTKEEGTNSEVESARIAEDREHVCLNFDSCSP